MASGTGGASASGLWGRARGGLAEKSPGIRGADGAVVDPHEVIMERSAALLPADSAAAAAGACGRLTALAQHLIAIGVDGDGLVWIPRGDLVSRADLAALLRDAPAAGLPVLIGATSPPAAADLAGLVGAVLTLRVTDPGLASRLADLTGVRILPAPAGLPAMPAVSPPPPADLRGAAGVQPAMPPVPDVPAVPGLTAVPGVPAMPGADQVHRPVVSPRTLQTLRRGEFVLAVNVPCRRLIAPGRLIPARLPRRAEPSFWRAPEGTGR